MAQSLEALLHRSIDYAGLFPPAALPWDQVLKNYETYSRSPHARFLNRLITPESIQGGIERAPNGAIYREALDPPAGEFAKIRTGGLTPDQFPSVAAVASFIRHQAHARRAFKATAGLHHPVRTAVMHGFLNVFLASVFAWHGREELIEPVLSSEDPTQFAFTDRAANWDGHEVATPLIIDARANFIHSFGSCSFEEPVQELEALGFLK